MNQLPQGTRVMPYGTLLCARYINELAYVFVADNRKQIAVVPAAVIEKQTMRNATP